jgi:2'-5' RNA ligase
MGGELTETQQIYERLWQKAALAFEAGRPGIDPQLPDKTNDSRRGLTLLLRPNRAVQRSINAFLGKLADAAPGQYFYRPEEFHVTVLAIIPGSERWRDKIRHLAACRSMVNKVLKEHREFSIVFRGVTATADAVMIQGFPGDDTLLQIRNHLREKFRSSALSNELDRRYRIHAAHLTIMRFCRPDTDWKHLKGLLEANRETPFGETRVNSLQLVLTDWYSSADQVRLLDEYRLGQ